MLQDFSQLTSLGWSDFFAHQINSQPQPQEDSPVLLWGRVIEVQRELARVSTGEAEWWCTPSGRFRTACAMPGDWPAVGDWAGIAPQETACALSDDPGRAILHRRLARRGQFVRLAPGSDETMQVLAANLDAIVLVTACNGELNLRRIERYLTATAESGARPIIALNKADLLDDDGRAAILRAVQAAAPGVPVVFTHTLDESGVAPLREFLRPQETIALLGSSGVGKSSLTNRLAGRELQFVSAIRDADDRGRHTTTARRIVALPNGALLMDTPGLRTVRLWDDGGGVDETFAEITALAAGCKFRDCKHRDEPGCAVAVALTSGMISPERLAARDKLAREAAFQSRKHDQIADHEMRRKLRAFGRQLRARPSKREVRS